MIVKIVCRAFMIIPPNHMPPFAGRRLAEIVSNQAAIKQLENHIIIQTRMQGDICCFPQKSALCDPGIRGKAGEIGVDEAVEPAVHHGVHVRGLIARARVLDERVGHEDVVADLAAPLDLELRALDIGDLVEMLALLISMSLERSMRMQVSRFWNWSRCVWQETTMPVGLWMRRTAELVLLMCWPPAPEER